MALIRRCPNCGAEYVTRVERCFDCDIELVDTDDGIEPAGPAYVPKAADLSPDPSAASRSAPAVDTAPPEHRHAANDADAETSAAETSDAETLADADAEAASGAVAGPGQSTRRATGDRASGQVAYEFHEWSGEARALLEQLLLGAGIARAWEGTTLVVGATDEAQVDELVDDVELADQPTLDPDAEKVVYEVHEWTADQLIVLTDSLVDAGVGYEFDMAGDLVVLADDETTVERTLDAIGVEGPEGEGAGEAAAATADEGDDDTPEDDGFETVEILSELLQACDRLRHDPFDSHGILTGRDAADRLDGRSLPFGFNPKVWADVQSGARRLRDDIEDDDIDDEQLSDHAESLRILLRPYV